jgi:hypothetical protein
MTIYQLLNYVVIIEKYCNGYVKRTVHSVPSHFQLYWARSLRNKLGNLRCLYIAISLKNSSPFFFAFVEFREHEMHLWVKHFVQKSQLPVSSVSVESLVTVRCQHNRPLYVIRSGERSGIETVRKVRSQKSCMTSSQYSNICVQYIVIYIYTI